MAEQLTPALTERMARQTTRHWDRGAFLATFPPKSAIMYHILDLHFQSIEHAIGSFLVQTQDGPVLIESGPYSTFPHLTDALAKHGIKISDIRHLLLSHIHFDHAGAAWAFAEAGATIYLHPFGADHMHDPSKLVASATMIYGDQMDTLWGKMAGIPKAQLKTMAHEECLQIGGETFRALHTPGHAKHHLAWQWGSTIFCGDVAGVKIDQGPVVPPCPPPDINIEDWHQSIETVLAQKPDKLVLTHYGEINNPDAHLQQLKSILTDWSQWVKAKWESGMSNEEMVPLFQQYTKNQLRQQGVSEQGLAQYEAANPAFMSVAGLVRYWKKKQQA